MGKKPVKYCLVDTFTDTAFKGNPTATCLLEEDDDDKDFKWLSSVAQEFNQPVISYLTPLQPDHLSIASDEQHADNVAVRFHLRWFTCDGDEVSLCGHATLGASHFLLSRVFPNRDVVELSTLSGPLFARRIPNDNGSFSTELNFPVLPLVDYDTAEVPTVSKFLNGAPVVEIKQTTSQNYLLVVLPSGEDVKQVVPQLDAIRKYPARGVIVTGPALCGSGFDFYSRFFSPNFGANEDHVCGSSHCALAPYWGQRLGKHDFVSYYASKRSGVINVHLDEKNQRVLIRGNAVIVMEGSILV